MDEKLSQFHVTILIFMTQSGMVIFSLPRLVAQHFGTNGWLSLPFISLIVSINICLIAAVYHLGKGKSIFEILEQSIPKWVLSPFYIFIMACWAIFGCLIGKKYILIFQMLAFPTASPVIFKLVFDLLLFAFIIKGIYNMSKAVTVYFLLTIWMILLLFYFYPDFQWERLTPFVFQDRALSIQGFQDVYAAFLGFELSLLFFPYINKKTKILKAVLTGNLIVTLYYTYLCLIAFGTYGQIYLKTLQYPLLSMFAYMQFPFIQGTEILFYSFFMFSIITTSGLYLWASKETGRRIFPINEKLLTLCIVLFTYGFSYLPKTMNELDHLLTILSYILVCSSFLLPIGLILLLLVQRMRGE